MTIIFQRINNWRLKGHVNQNCPQVEAGAEWLTTKVDITRIQLKFNVTAIVLESKNVQSAYLVLNSLPTYASRRHLSGTTFAVQLQDLNTSLSLF